jgi:tetratricopeptide (TPR) repeat protein
VQDRFLAAVQAEEAGEKQRAITLYEEILGLDPKYAAAYINLGTILFHQRSFSLAEELYRRASEVDPGYVLAFFDLGNVLDELQRPDESIAAYRQAVALSPRYADAHYNLALAYERKNERRKALRHWQTYIKLDRSGPWAEHARGQIRKLLSHEKLSIARRATGFIPHRRGAAGAAAQACLRRGRTFARRDARQRQTAPSGNQSVRETTPRSVCSSNRIKEILCPSVKFSPFQHLPLRCSAAPP